MTLVFIAIDPETDGDHCPAVFVEEETGELLLQGWTVTNATMLAEVGEIYATETPGGEAAVAVHRGPYDRMNEAYNAIDRWMAVNRRESAGHSWEVYGDPAPDPARTETMVVHLLK